MNWFETLLLLAEKITDIIDINLRRKYQDKLLQLKTDYRNEYNKPLESRSDAVLDLLSAELRDVATAIAADIGVKNS